MKKKLLVFCSIVLILALGGCYYVSTKPAFSAFYLVSKIRNNSDIEKHIDVKNFTDSLGKEVWRNVNNGSPTLQKFKNLDKSFQPFLSKMIASYTKSILTNKSKLIKINELSYFNYFVLQARIFYLVAIKPHIYPEKGRAKIAINNLNIMKYNLHFELVFKKNKDFWQIYAIENLEL